MSVQAGTRSKPLSGTWMLNAQARIGITAKGNIAYLRKLDGSFFRKRTKAERRTTWPRGAACASVASVTAVCTRRQEWGENGPERCLPSRYAPTDASVNRLPYDAESA